MWCTLIVLLSIIIIWFLYHLYLHILYLRKLYRNTLGYTTKETNQFLYILYVPFNYLKIGKSKLLYRRLQNHRTALCKLRIIGIIPVSDCTIAENVITRWFNYLSTGSTEHYKLDIFLILFVLMVRNKELTNLLQKHFSEL